ncbi:hypothetical protein H5410_061593 [Solanum commersonii]|uniref:CCHC-type domain-containing protein n=1 Tax=Solanum commersonii TaxID=4109 RepID=A0A9J5W856_SOLCO|nr:hypothetical protein H5410_061593 [Solanum commersonii]
MIHREGFEQREGKGAHHSGNFCSTPPRSRGYSRRGYHSHSRKPIHIAISIYEADYARHSTPSSVHTPHSLSSRPVVCGGHSVHSGFSHHPTSRRGCFECSNMGHFVRDCPKV